MKRWAIVFLLMVSLVSGVSAEIIATENFDYADGPIAGADGGTGWNGVWTERNVVASNVVNGQVVQTIVVNGDRCEISRDLPVTLDSVWIRASVWKSDAANISATFGGIGVYNNGGENGLIGNFWGRPVLNCWGINRYDDDGESREKFVTSPSLIIANITGSSSRLWVNPDDFSNLGTPDGYGGGSNPFNQIWLRCGSGEDGLETWNFDNLIIATTQDDVTNGLIASDSPRHWETNILTDTSVSWYAPIGDTIDDVVGYTVYFDPNYAYVDNSNVAEMDYYDDAIPGTVTSFTPSTGLAFNSTYYWKVEAQVHMVGDEAGVYQTISSPVFSFTTIPQVPMITSNPVSVIVEEGGTATFTVEHLNGTDFKWYRNGELLAGANEATLVIEDVDSDKEAFFYCNVSNDALPEGLDTDTVGLWVKRQIAHWSFDDTLIDSIDGWVGVPTEPNAVIVYEEDAISGKSIHMFEDGDYVEVQDSVDYFNFYTRGYTTCAWIKTDFAGAVISKEIDGWTNGWAMTTNGGNLTHTLRRYGDMHDSSQVLDNEWHFLAITLETGYDPENPNAKLMRTFVDGLKTREVVYTGTIPTTTASLKIGMQTDTLIFPWDGLIDELSMWNYALTAREIAQMYANGSGESFCYELPEYDFDGNCQVDLYDFNAFASTWLQSNVISPIGD